MKFGFSGRKKTSARTGQEQHSLSDKVFLLNEEEGKAAVSERELSEEEKQHEFEEAMRLFIRIGQRHSKDQEAYLKEAVEEVQKRDNWIYYNQFGMACQRIGAYWEATEGYDMAIARSPENEHPIIYTNLGQTYFMWNARERTDELKSKAIYWLEQAGEVPEALNTLACIYDPNLEDNYEKDGDKAIEYYYRTAVAYIHKGQDLPEKENEFRANIAVLCNNIGVIYGNNKYYYTAAAAYASAAAAIVPANGLYKKNKDLWRRSVKRRNPELLDEILAITSVEEARTFVDKHPQQK